MNARIWLTGLIALGVLAGCGGQEKYALEVRSARDSLERNFPEKAEVHLARADQLAEKYDLVPAPDATLLKAEARIQLKDLATAEALAAGVAEEYVPGTRPRAQAEEILGKIAIRRGDFRGAMHHLVQADRSYESAGDKQRVADLLLLAGGLEAYGRGQMAEARRTWEKISDPRLRVAIDVRREAVR
jgi:tetratricopeptide (TPR) repeat protein